MNIHKRTLAMALCLPFATTGCGDDTSADGTGAEDPTDGSFDWPGGDEYGSTTGSTSTGGSSTTSELPTSTGGGSTDETAAGETAAGETAAGETAAGETAAGETAAGETAAGIDPFGVPFTVLDPYPLPTAFRVQTGWTVITSAAEWDAQTAGAPVPAGVSFDDQWLVYGSLGPQPLTGHNLEVTGLTWDSGQLVVDGRASAPDVDCETFRFTWPTDTLLAIDALPVGIDQFDDRTVPEVNSCADIGGDEPPCDRVTLCPTDHLCAGIIRSTVLGNSPDGTCLAEDYAGVFSGGPVAIPGDGTTVEASLTATGLTSVDMDVAIWVELDHPDPSELVIELRNPSGNRVTVATNPSDPLHPGGVGIVPLGFSGDESVNGTWTLVVTDTVDNALDGAVVSWELEIMSRWD